MSCVLDEKDEGVGRFALAGEVYICLRRYGREGGRVGWWKEVGVEGDRTSVDPSEIEKLFVSVIETRKVTLGADHPFTLTSMNNVALLRRAKLNA